MANSVSKFDIKIAVVGCESTGKSTVVNAICAAECTQVNYRRTTEGINIFHLIETPSLESPASIQDSDQHFDSRDSDSHDRKRPSEDIGGSDKKRLKLVETIFKRIKAKNVDNAGSGAGISTFEVPVKELPITMRDDCRLCLVEAPGMNTSDNSRDYFSDNWDTFDAVVLVMDSQEKVDHRDQIENMEFIHKLLKKKNIPCFILCNKVSLLISSVTSYMMHF
jgi:signal recognition particle receptor subunit beta